MCDTQSQEIGKDRMRDNRASRLKERLEKLKSRRARRYFLSNMSFPENEKQKDRDFIISSLHVIENVLPKVKDLVKGIRTHIEYIWDQSPILAAYLLMGKALSNLESIISLAKGGHVLEVVELIRSGQESLDLAFLFMEGGQEQRLNKWFNGEIIENAKARKALQTAINKMGFRYPVKSLKSEVYKTLSLYTHSSYGALFDAIDIYHEDFDFDKYAGFHYTREYLPTVEDLLVKILLELKNIFVKQKDMIRLDATEKLLKEFSSSFASESEIRDISKLYSK